MKHLQQAGASFDEAQAQGTEQAPSTQEQVNDQTGSPTVGAQDIPQDVTDLSKLEKFVFEGKEWTADQLKKSIMLHSDYTKKTQDLSENRKYYDNLQYDLDSVRANPALADKFKEVYPKSFHKYLDYVSSQTSSAQSSPSQGHQAIPDDVVSAVLQRIQPELERSKGYIQQVEAEKYEAKLNNLFGTLSKKYPDAVEDVVLARAQTYLDKGEALTDQTWERLWKQSHDQMVKRDQERKSQTLQTQRQSNQSFKGPPQGGEAPMGVAPKMKLKDVADHIIKSMK